MTSSETRSTPWRSQISRTRWKYPGGGGKQPPAFCTGSRYTAATVLGPLAQDGPLYLVGRPLPERHLVVGEELGAR